MSPTSWYVLTPFTPRIQIPQPSVMACHPRYIIHYTEHARPLVTFHALSRDLPDHPRWFNTRNINVIPLQLLYFFPWHFPIFPLHLPIFQFYLVELVSSLSIVYMNSATSGLMKSGRGRQPSRPRISQTHHRTASKTWQEMRHAFLGPEVTEFVTVPKHSGINSTGGEKLKRLLILSCTGPFWYTQQFYFQHTLRLYIIHGTDKIMTQYDTGRTEIPFGPFDVCIWESFSRPGLPNKGTPHQCPSCGIFAEPLN
jgi:hypothetical protein